jgi:gliding motility-associated-like protein
MKIRIFLVLILASCSFASAQLGFCSGASSEAIFTEDFGIGPPENRGPLNAAQTNYRYVNDNVQDGEYTISSKLQQLGSFHDVNDLTGTQNGRALIVNASFAPDQFYQTDISGLCENTNYEFSAWIMNLYNPASGVCTGSEIPVQVRFEIWDATDSNRLAQGVMVPRTGENQPTWIPYGLTFTTAAGQNGCILKMINEGSGGCGNDLAIDDIVFRTCGDVVQIKDDTNSTTGYRCFNDMNESIDLEINTIEAIYNSPEYQWQSSTDSVNFTDITGENSSILTLNTLDQTTFYRVKIAEDAVNLSASECVNFSEVFEYRLVQVPSAIPVMDRVVVCTKAIAQLEVGVQSGVITDWYDAATGGNLLQADSNTLQVNQPGTYYAQTRDAVINCVNDKRVAIEFKISQDPVLNNEDITICPDTPTILDTQFLDAASYEWSTGERTQTITVKDLGIYTCVVANDTGCIATATFEVDFVKLPEIIRLEENRNELAVITNDGDFLYRYNGGNFQSSNVLNIYGLLQVEVEVSDLQNCSIVTSRFNRLRAPEFFTPNADGFNDLWQVSNLAAFPGSRVEMFDRYGKLLKVMTSSDEGWNGFFNSKPLPSSDYWYRVYYEDQEINGHFSLKR